MTDPSGYAKLLEDGGVLFVDRIKAEDAHDPAGSEAFARRFLQRLAVSGH